MQLRLLNNGCKLDNLHQLQMLYAWLPQKKVLKDSMQCVTLLSLYSFKYFFCSDIYLFI